MKAEKPFILIIRSTLHRLYFYQKRDQVVHNLSHSSVEEDNGLMNTDLSASHNEMEVNEG